MSLRTATRGDYDFLFTLHIAAMKEYVDKTWGWDDAVQQAIFFPLYRRRVCNHSAVLVTGFHVCEKR